MIVVAISACGSRSDLSRPLASDASTQVGDGCSGRPPNVATTVSPDLDQVTGLAVDATYVYWTVGDGRVMRAPVDLCAPPQTIATHQAFPLTPVIDSEFIYWGNAGNGSISKMPLEGGAAISLATTPPPSGLVLTQGHLYWTDGLSISTMSVDGSSATTLIGENPSELIITFAVDASGIYWDARTTSPSIEEHLMAAALDGTDTRLLFSTTQWVNGLALGDSDLYWTEMPDPNGSVGSVLAIPKAGGASSVLAPNEAIPASIAVDGNILYWIDEHSGVRRLELNGGNPTLVTTDYAPHGIVVKPTALVWANYDVKDPKGEMTDVREQAKP